jgi:hypothetical protein
VFLLVGCVATGILVRRYVCPENPICKKNAQIYPIPSNSNSTNDMTPPVICPESPNDAKCRTIEILRQMNVPRTRVPLRQEGDSPEQKHRDISSDTIIQMVEIEI